MKALEGFIMDILMVEDIEAFREFWYHEKLIDESASITAEMATIRRARHIEHFIFATPRAGT